MLNLTDIQRRACWTSGHFKRYEFVFFDEITKTTLFVLDAEKIHTESVTIKEAICEDTELKLGGCIASSCEFEVSEVLAQQTNLSGLKFKAYLHVYEENKEDNTSDNDNTDWRIGSEVVVLPMGEYRVQSVDMVNDQDYKKVTAYDDLYDWSIDVSDWYNNLFPANTTTTTYESEEASDYDISGSSSSRVAKTQITYGTVTIGEMRRSLLKFLYEVSNKTYPSELSSKKYPNDDVSVTKTIITDGEILGTDILKYICELNAGYGRMNRYGDFELSNLMNVRGTYPEENLFPEDSKGIYENLYPEDAFIYLGEGSDEDQLHPDYITSHHEEYNTQPISCVTFRLNNPDSESDEEYGVSYPPNSTDNPYVSNNPIVLELSESQLSNVAKNVFYYLENVVYRPNTTTLDGIPYYEPGDYYNVSKTYDSFESFVFSRTLTGIQGMRDEFVATGVEVRENNVTPMDEKYQVLAKYMSIHKSNEGLSLVVADLEANTKSQLDITATQISTEVSNNSDVWNEVDDNGEPLDIYVYFSGTKRDSKRSLYTMVLSEDAPEPFLKLALDTSTGIVYKVFSYEKKEKNGVSYNKLTLVFYKQLTKKSTTMSTRITQNADSISLEAERAIKAENGLEEDYTAQFKVTAERITAEANAAITRENGLKDDYSSRFEVSAVEISSQVSHNSDKWDIKSVPVSCRVYGIKEYSGKYFAVVAKEEAESSAAYVNYVLDEQNGKYYQIADIKIGYNWSGGVYTTNAQLAVLVCYYSGQFQLTTAQLASSITQTAEQIRLEVSETYDTKENARASLAITAASISSEVSKNADTWDTGGYSIAGRVYGIKYSEEWRKHYAVFLKSDVPTGTNWYILDEQDGRCYFVDEANPGYVWDDNYKSYYSNDQMTTVKAVYHTEFKRMTAQLSSRIKQTATSIDLSTTDGGTTAGINIKIRNEDGTELGSKDANITLSGLVAFTDLSGNGTTTIDGSNIKTGTISADRIDSNLVRVGNLSDGTTTISGNNIKTGTISADRISTGTISGSTIRMQSDRIDFGSDQTTTIIGNEITTEYIRSYKAIGHLIIGATSNYSTDPNIDLDTTPGFVGVFLDGGAGVVDLRGGAVHSWSPTGFYDYVNFHSTVNLNSTVNSTGIRDATTSSGANGFINATTGHMGRSTASSKRYKHDITTDIKENLNPEKILDIPVSQYKYNVDYLSNVLDQRYNTDVIGIIAEDVADHYPVACEFDDYGMVENWNERYLIPPMLSLLQEAYGRIEKLEEMVQNLSGGNLL